MLVITIIYCTHPYNVIGVVRRAKNERGLINYETSEVFPELGNEAIQKLVYKLWMCFRRLISSLVHLVHAQEAKLQCSGLLVLVHMPEHIC